VYLQGLIWLNTLLTIVWPKLAKNLGNFLQATVNDLVAQCAPQILPHVCFFSQSRPTRLADKRHR
jgi:hypothetical protein